MNTIKPGSTVTVKVIKTPTASAAAKTIVRVLSKDPAAQKENLRLALPAPHKGRQTLWRPAGQAASAQRQPRRVRNYPGNGRCYP